MIPLFHDFDGETVLILGGGSVGARKARRFAREARTVVVSPRFVDDDWGDAELLRAAPDVDEIGDWIDRFDPVLVVAATDDEAVNDAAEAAARDRGALVNRTDHSGGRDAGSVVVPATVDDGDVTVAVSTSGASPALSKYLRERIEAEIGDAGAMAELTGEIRSELRAEGMPPADRRAAVNRVVRSPRVWKALRAGIPNARSEADRVIRNERGESR